MDIAFASDMGFKLCESLNLKSKLVKNIELKLRAGCPAILVIEKYVSTDEAEAIMLVVDEFVLEVRKKCQEEVLPM